MLRKKKERNVLLVIIMGMGAGGDVLSGVNVGRVTDRSLAASLVVSLCLYLSESISGSCR